MPSLFGRVIHNFLLAGSRVSQYVHPRQMPRTCNVSPKLFGLIAYQDGVVHRDQALAAGLTPAAVRDRIRRKLWRELLPGFIWSVLVSQVVDRC